MGFGDSYIYGANIGPIIPFLILATVTLLCIKDDVNDSVKKASEIDNEKCIALLKQYKELLETNAISKEDYEKIKNDILNKKEN